MRTLKHREVKSLGQSHTAISQDLNRRAVLLIISLSIRDMLGERLADIGKYVLKVLEKWICRNLKAFGCKEINTISQREQREATKFWKSLQSSS